MPTLPTEFTDDEIRELYSAIRYRRGDDDPLVLKLEAMVIAIQRRGSNWLGRWHLALLEKENEKKRRR